MPPTVASTADAAKDRRRGLLLMLLATAAFAVMALFVKLLREDGLSTSEVMFWRTAPGLAWVWAELRVRGQRLWPNAPGLVVTRSLYGVAAMSFYFYSLRALTMIEYTVLHLLQPVIVAVLAPAMLHERLRRNAVVALIVAIVGALVVLRPDRAMRADLPVLALLAGMAAALCSALAHITVRKAMAKDSAENVVFWFTVVVSICALLGGLAQGEFRGLPAGLELLEASWKIAGLAGFGLAGQLLMTRAYGKASAPVIAIVAYAAIPMAIAVDLLAWSVLPSASAVVGSLLMVGAGVLLVRGREV
ncbi:DMT family transporter [Nannocystaceae bacterium ST9]